MAPLFLVAALVAAVPPPAPDKTKELVIVILIDAVRAREVGAYGYPLPTTPNIDALAKTGTRYTHAYANAPWTRPSTTCLLTGLNASRHRTETENSVLPPEVTTLAERLKKVGWHTAGFTANGNGGSLAGLQKGFDVFEDPTRTYTKDKRGKTYNGLPTGGFIVDRALSFLKTSKADKQFVFMFLVDPHDPYQAPPELESLFLGDFKGKIRRQARWEYDNDYPEDERFSLKAIYDAGIRYADQAVGELVTGLAKLGRQNGTTIFITSDHGEGFGEHGFYLHAHQFWEEIIHVPLIAIGPRFPAAVDDRLTQTIDVSATIAAAAGADPTGLMGAPLFDAARPDAHIVSEYNEFGIHRQAIRGDTYKVVWQRPADLAWYLRTAKKKEFFPSVSFDAETVHAFDLKADPDERVNLAPNLPAAAQRLLDELRRFVGGAIAAH
ncbi:MAG: sulfatase [Deltaproteobacteria bacterium]|nr:sulfatase [Deltaproteobacteria bacterium]